ncbi:MAG: MlaD family protein [Planctomycetes bacterium]|nr:MlaD family protein [Planctomycetota bacterium]
MMRQDRRLRVGVTLTALTALLFVLVFSLDGALSWWRGTALVEVRFSNVQGLREDDPVEFCGVPCGRVRSLSFTAAPAAAGVATAFADSGETSPVSVQLALEVPRDVRALLTSGTRATVDKTLTGVTVVGLAPGSGASLAEGAVIEGVQGATIADVAGEMKDAAGQLRAILGTVRATLDELAEERLVVETLERLRASAGEAEQFLADLRELADENRAPVREVAERTAALAAELEHAAQELSPALAEIRASAHRVDGFVGDLRGWFLQHRGEMSKTTEEVAVTSENLSSLSQELRRRPWRLLHSPSEEEEQMLDLAESADRYARGAIALRRAAERIAILRDAAAADPEQEAALAQALAEIEACIARQQSIEDGFWQRLQSIDD